MTDNIEALLHERNKTHGSFADNAACSQQIKGLFHTARAWNGLHDVHREVLDMIAVKLSRILSGQAGFADHWNDIAGYATLASEACVAELLSSTGENQR
jgi:hypothetical protein